MMAADHITNYVGVDLWLNAIVMQTQTVRKPSAAIKSAISADVMPTATWHHSLFTASPQFAPQGTGWKRRDLPRTGGAGES
ncbi:hypothetical protein TI10_08225 [Photorhabdus luminescens subsp. luminescens]|nr:hypothetical protein TI10_08225 [Photorhabdus luminescens subsp. luminescens]